MNTLIITHNQLKKKFQWKQNYNPADLIYLLTSVFKVKDKIIGLKDCRGSFPFFFNIKIKKIKEKHSIFHTLSCTQKKHYLKHIVYY